MNNFTKNEWELDEFDPFTVRCIDKGELICNTSVATEKTKQESLDNAKLISLLPVIIDRLDGLYSDIKDGHKVNKNFESYNLAKYILDYIYGEN